MNNNTAILDEVYQKSEFLENHRTDIFNINMSVEDMNIYLKTCNETTHPVLTYHIGK
jgi:hypothetical protein